jgi:hypothetical protein
VRRRAAMIRANTTPTARAGAIHRRMRGPGFGVVEVGLRVSMVCS